MKQSNSFTTLIFSRIKNYLSIILVILSAGLIAQSPGDILFTGYNADGPDEFCFIATTSIAGNQQIHFTDNGWTSANGGEFRITEGEVLYTTPVQGLKPGEQVAIQVGSGSAPSVIYGGGSASQVGSNSIILSSAGDGIIAFTGSLISPQPLAVITTDGSGWTNPVSNTQTNLPNSLVVGETAFLLLENGVTESDNWIYNCDTVYGSPGDLQLAIGQLDNWTSHNSLPFSLPCSPFTSTWNGTWSPSAPSAQNNIIINSSAPITSELNCRALTINIGENLSLGNHNLYLGGNLINNGNGINTTGIIHFNKGDSTLTLSGNPFSVENIVEVETGCILNADSNLIIAATSQNSFGQIDGDGEVVNLIIQKYIDPTNPKYFYMGIPLKNALLKEFNEGNILQSSNSIQGSIWEWDASDALWKAPGDVNLTTSIPAKAYAIFCGTNSFGTFVLGSPGALNYLGSPNMGVIQIALNYNDGQSSGSPIFVGGTSLAFTQGWNLVSNPYPSYYDWDLQTIPNNMGSAIYRFDGSNYTSYLKGAGTGSRFIDPGEGYFVQLHSNTPADLVFNPNNRNPNKNLGSSKSINGFDGFSIRIESKNHQTSDETFLGFESLATQNFDANYDAWKLMNQSLKPNIYTGMQDGYYSINRLNLYQNTTIPLSVNHSLDGDSLEMIFDFKKLISNCRVLIEDLKTGKIYKAQEINKLIYSHEASFRKDRFRIHLEEIRVSKDEEKANDLSWFISQNNNGIEIHKEDLFPKTIRIYSLEGILMKSTIMHQQELQIDLANSGIYLVQMVTNQTKSTCRKVVFQKQ